MRRLALSFACLAVVACCSPAVSAPVATGRLEYHLSWNGIPAADAILDIRRDPRTAEPIYSVDTTARTSWLVDLLWSLRAYAGSQFNAATPTPFWFRYDRHINDERWVTNVEFEPLGSRARGTFVRRGDTRVMEVDEPGVLDPISAIFDALSRPVTAGDSLHYEIFTGESRYKVDLDIRGEESIYVAGAERRALRVEPRFWRVGRGLDTRVRNATVWVSEEPVRALLRIRTDVFIGAVTCELQNLPTAASMGATASRDRSNDRSVESYLTSRPAGSVSGES